MPELSPAAQRVLQLANDAVEALPLDSSPVSFSLVLIAAALEAAADQPYEVPSWYRGDDCQTYRDGADAQRNRTLSIAAELKAHD
jgi:hypothetical protein